MQYKIDQLTLLCNLRYMNSPYFGISASCAPQLYSISQLYGINEVHQWRQKKNIFCQPVVMHWHCRQQVYTVQYSILWVCRSGSVNISPNPYNNVDRKVYENHKNIRIAKGFNVFV